MQRALSHRPTLLILATDSDGSQCTCSVWQRGALLQSYLACSGLWQVSLSADGWVSLNEDHRT